MTLSSTSFSFVSHFVVVWTRTEKESYPKAELQSNNKKEAVVFWWKTDITTKLVILRQSIAELHQVKPTLRKLEAVFNGIRMAFLKLSSQNHRIY